MSCTLFSVFVALVCVVNAQTPNCTGWCNLMFSTGFTNACSSSTADADFNAIADCYSYCARFNIPVGSAGATSGNSIGCRTYYAGQAAGGDSSACGAASISGGNVCGSYCEAYCTVELNGTCNASYPGGWGQCMGACASFPTDGVDFGEANPSNWYNSVQCRTYHAGTPALANNVHCAHATPHGGNICVDTTGDYCTGYCQLFTMACTGANQPTYLSATPYSSTDTEQACLDYCNAYALLANSQTPPYFTAANWVPSLCVGDTIDCRTYHSVAALLDPTLHCPHASLDGAGVCGNECSVYCNLASNPSCTADINFGTSTCASTCAGYAAGTVGSSTGNSLQCRIYHLTYALEVPNPHCNHGTTQGPCATSPVPPPPASTTSTPPPPATSSTSGTSLICGSLVILLLGVASFM